MPLRGSQATPGLSRADALWSTAVGTIAFAIYVRTLAPGLVPILDTPGFQFVGRVLGTLHNPGYPAYVLLTHLWSYLPVGSLAYRINLFSAVMAGLAVAGVFLVARSLEVRRWIAGAAALGFAFGSIYWSQAVIAEVYALNAAIIAWILVAVGAWQRTRRTGFLLAAALLFALGIGNHTTIVLFAPGVLLHTVLVDRRQVLRARFLVPVTIVLSLGLCQYLFILLRTRMNAIYLESTASTLGQLVDVIRGAQFEHALFTFSVREVLTDRLAVILRFVASELSLPLLVFAVAGVVILAVSRRRGALPLLAGGAGSLLFVLNYDAGDIHVFTIPLLLVLWICAAAGVEWTNLKLRTAGPAVVPAAFAAAIGVFPLWQLTRNFADRDLSDDTHAMREMAGLFDALPDDSFLVRENFVLDRMLMYKILGERAGGDREIQAHHSTPEAAAAMVGSGRHVFAFAENAHQFRYHGVDVGFAPFAIHGWTPRDFILELPDGTIVAIGVPGAVAVDFFEAVGGIPSSLADTGSTSGREQSALAVAGVTGDPSGSSVRFEGRSEARVTRGQLAVSADATSAAIAYRGRELVRTDEGIVLAVLGADETIQTVRVLTSGQGFRIRSTPSPFTPYPVRGLMPSQELGPEWEPLEGDTGLWLVSVGAGSAVDIRSERRAGCDLRAVEKSDGGLRISGEPEADDVSADTAARYQHVTMTGGEAAGAFVTAGCRVMVWARARGAKSFARSASLSGLLDLPERASETVLMARTQQSWLLGGGWSAVETSESGPHRWIEEHASLLLPIEQSDVRRLRIQVRGSDAGGAALQPVIDGSVLEAKAVADGWGWYEWDLAGPLEPGVHELVLTVKSAAVRVAVSQIELLRPRQW